MTANPTTPAEQLAILQAYPRRYSTGHPPEPTEQINHAMSLEQRAEAMAEGEPVGWREADRAADLYYGDVL